MLFSMDKRIDTDITGLSGTINKLQNRLKDEPGNLAIDENEDIFREAFFNM